MRSNTIIKIFTGIILVLFSVFLDNHNLFAQEIFLSKQGKLEDIQIDKKDGSLQVDIIVSPFNSHREFVLVDPDRLVVDLIQTHAIGTQRNLEIQDHGVIRIRIGQFKPDVVRVVFDLDDPVPSYKLESFQNGIKIIFTTHKIKEQPKVKIQVETPPKKQEEDPAVRALQAEMDEHWEDALEIYKSILEKDSNNVEMWIRAANIEARLNHPDNAAEALKKAVQLKKNDASLYSALSKAYAVADKPEQALLAIKEAVSLEPTNTAYLHDQASLANWVADYDTSKNSYEKILSLSPDDSSALLGLARVTAWSGKLSRSVALYKKYIENNRDDKIAFIEFVRVESWRGNYPFALDLLDKYEKAYGKTPEYLQERARILAWAMRPRASLAITTTILQKDPQNYQLNISHAIALKNGFYLKEALDALDAVQKLNPDNPQTEITRLFVETSLRSNLVPGFSYYTDTSDLTIYRGMLDFSLKLQAPTFLQAGAGLDRLNSRFGTGLEQWNGKENARHDFAWLGLEHRLAPGLGLDAKIGWAQVEGGRDEIITYNVSGDFWPHDTFRLGLERNHHYFIVSPRTVGLGITRTLNRLRLSYEPGIRYHIDADLSYATQSDSNIFKELIFSPRRVVSRTEKLNLDLGLGAWLFGYKRNLNNGYYDPEFYQRYYVSGFGYWKIGDNDGIGFIFSAGIQKDENSDQFRFSGTAEAEGTFGIYRDIMFKIRGGYFELRLLSGAFRAYLFQIGVTGRL